jgi:nitroreductase
MEEPMNITEAIRARRSIRRYKEGIRIPHKDITIMLEAAMMAPSSGNTRPWEFVVIENQDTIKELTDIHPYARMFRTASAAILVCGRPDLQPGVYGGFWPQDCGAATENMLLQAMDLGYGTCWCGLYPLEDRVKKVQEMFQIHSIPYAIVALGVPDQEPEARGFFDEERVHYIK